MSKSSYGDDEAEAVVLASAANYPDGHPALAGSLNNLGVVLKAAGSAEKALPFYEQALAMYRALYPAAKYPDGHPHLWTGDSLFPGGVGNTFGDADAFATLIDDVEQKLFARLPDETWFYPGHGNDSTLGAERGSLPEWRERGW